MLFTFSIQRRLQIRHKIEAAAIHKLLLSCACGNKNHKLQYYGEATIDLNIF